RGPCVDGSTGFGLVSVRARIVPLRPPGFANNRSALRTLGAQPTGSQEREVTCETKTWSHSNSSFLVCVRDALAWFPLRQDPRPPSHLHQGRPDHVEHRRT